MTKMTELSNYRKFRDLANDYNEELSDYRKRNGLAIADVVAMSQQNDPFWMTPGKIFKAQWAFNIMEKIVKPHIKRIDVPDIHLRDIHYILTGMDYPNWNGFETYQNTDAHWGDLIKGFANARYLELIDPMLIRDNKNKYEERTTYRQDWDFEKRKERGKEDLNKEEVLDIFISWFDGLKNWHNHMPVHIELWAEKDLALLDKVAEEYNINTVVGEGETSVTQVFQIINRIKKANKPVRIGYVTDFDVVGTNISKAMSRKMEFIIRKLEEAGFDVKLTHLMLTPSQVIQYDLPLKPMKKSKTGAYETRKNEWMEARGLSGAVEINAFHALYPDDFKAILENFINSYFDEEIKEKVEEFNEEQSDIIKEIVSNNDKINSLLEEFLKALIEEIDEIDWDVQEIDYDADFIDLIDTHEEKDYSDRDEHYQWMLDSDLEYWTQLDRYNDYEAGKLDNPEERKQE